MINFHRTCKTSNERKLPVKEWIQQTKTIEFKKKTGVNTPVLNWMLFSVIYLPFCSVNLTWTQQSISSNSHQNTLQSSSRCQMLLKALHGLPKTLLAEKLLESNCFLKNNQDTVSSELSLIMADPENWHKFGSNCDKSSFQ